MSISRLGRTKDQHTYHIKVRLPIFVTERWTRSWSPSRCTGSQPAGDRAVLIIFPTILQTSTRAQMLSVRVERAQREWSSSAVHTWAVLGSLFVTVWQLLKKRTVAVWLLLESLVNTGVCCAQRPDFSVLTDTNVKQRQTSFTVWDFWLVFLKFLCSIGLPNRYVELVIKRAYLLKLIC